MAASYPFTVKFFFPKTDLIDIVFSDHMNEVQDEVVAIEKTLGTNVQGNFPTVDARLDALEQTIATSTHVHTFGNPVGIVPGQSTGQGVATTYARSDHRHAVPAFGSPAASNPGDTAQVGSTGLFADAGHVHARETISTENIIPGGIMAEFGGPPANIPSGWIECAGQVLVRASNPQMFANLGTLWNIGGESGTQFRVPDTRGRFTVHAGNSPNSSGGNTTLTVGQIGGLWDHHHGNAATHTHPIGTHTHPLNSVSLATNTVSAPHRHYAEDNGVPGLVLWSSYEDADHSHNIPNHNHGGLTAAGSGTTGVASVTSLSGAEKKNPPYAVITKMIKLG